MPWDPALDEVQWLHRFDQGIGSYSFDYLWYYRDHLWQIAGQRNCLRKYCSLTYRVIAPEDTINWRYDQYDGKYYWFFHSASDRDSYLHQASMHVSWNFYASFDPLTFMIMSQL